MLGVGYMRENGSLLAQVSVPKTSTKTKTALKTFFVLYEKKDIWSINRLKADRSSPKPLCLYEIFILFITHLRLT